MKCKKRICVGIKRCILTLGAFAVCWQSGTPKSLLADGSEALGPASIPVASGSGVTAAGTGLICPPGNVYLFVPPGASVKQVLLYWEGLYCWGDEAGCAGQSSDNTILVKRSDSSSYSKVKGTLIGGPTWVGWTMSVTYRADITSLGIVKSGTNFIDVDGVSFDQSSDGVCEGADGAGIFVIYDDDTGNYPVYIRDGNDYALVWDTGELQSTALQTFTFPSSAKERSGIVWLFFSSVEGQASGGGFRPNSIEVTVNGVTTTISNRLRSNNGDEWDTVRIPVTIPAGASSLAVQGFSRDDNPPPVNPPDPASLIWNMGALHILDQKECLGDSDCLCIDTDVSDDLLMLSQSTIRQRTFLKRMVRKLGRSSCGHSKKIRKFIRRAKKQADSLSAGNFGFIYSTPGAVKVCQSNPGCVDVSNVEQMSQYAADSNKLLSLAVKAVKKRLKCYAGSARSKKTGKRNIKRAKQLNAAALGSLNNMPAIYSECS